MSCVIEGIALDYSYYFENQDRPPRHQIRAVITAFRTKEELNELEKRK